MPECFPEILNWLWFQPEILSSMTSATWWPTWSNVPHSSDWLTLCECPSPFFRLVDPVCVCPSPFFRLVDPVWVSVPILQTGWPCVCVRPHSSDWLTLRDCVSVCPHSSDWLTLRVCVRPHSSDWLTLCVCVCPHSLTVWHCVTLCLSPFFRLVDPVTVWVSVPILQTGYQTRLLVITCTVLYIPTIQTCCQSQTHLLVIIVHSHSSESGSFSNPNTVLVIIIQPHSSGWLSDPISNYCPLPCILRLTWGWHDINIQEHTIPFFRMVVRLFVPSLLDPVNIYCPPPFFRIVLDCSLPFWYLYPVNN